MAKTRLQAGNTDVTAVRRPTNTFSCLGEIAKNEGVKMLWKGSSMRLLRLSVSLAFMGVSGRI